MNFDIHPHFKRSYRKRILTDKKLIAKANERITLFLKNPTYPLLEDHPLTGDSKGFRAFSITGDIRVVYYVESDTAWFYDIGSHNQVYR